ncbi:MAG: hypothetical protein AAGA18_14545 [Verrucomicrobiota bacterium]
MSDSQKNLKLANILMGIGLMLLIVLSGVGISGLMGSNSGNLAVMSFFYTAMIGLIPLGLGFSIGAIFWMIILKRKANAGDPTQIKEQAA